MTDSTGEPPKDADNTHTTSWADIIKPNFFFGGEEFTYIPITVGVNPYIFPPLLIPSKKGETMSVLENRIKTWLNRKSNCKIFIMEEISDSVKEEDIVAKWESLGVPKEHIKIASIDEKSPTNVEETTLANRDDSERERPRKKRKITHQ